MKWRAVVTALALWIVLVPAAAVHAGHWAFEPVQKAGPPADPSGWADHPIDRFVSAAWRQRGLAPAPPADKYTLIRRLSFDLTGLPPTPEEVDAFVDDPSPDAYVKLVDRLLASPHYGERWAQHWLDVARYADTAGNAPDFPVPQAHRYRDWVIAAFNGDKPYDQFLREQISGDLMPAAPGEDAASASQRIVATGYLATARRFGMLGDAGPPDHLEVEDVLDTIGRSVLGLSLSCARCHDHKYDPVPTRDYYALYGIVAGTRFPFPGAEGNAAQKHFVALPTGEGDAYAVADGEQPADAAIQIGGSPGKLGDVVPRGFLTILGGDKLPPGTPGSGRLQLAEWLTRPSNPLTARVMVNRIWQHHFGKGLVATPNDFGARGAPPTHPELLDYLAARFVESGWSVKAMHRLILTSKAYQLASAAAEAADPRNEYLSRFSRARLDAEQIRDAMLSVSGALDATPPSGPHPFPQPGEWSAFTQHNPFLGDYESNKRSIYLMRQRIREHPYLSLFNGPSPSASTPTRSEATTPLQALFAMNDPFVHGCAEKLADRLISAESSAGGRISLGYRLALGRPPTPEESAEAEAAVGEFIAELSAAGVPADQQARAAWSAFARVLFGSNEFVFVD